MKTVKPGIRVKSNGRYVATKSINGKRYYKEFSSQREAQKWKDQFHPLAAPVAQKFELPTASDQSNGRNNSITFREVYDRYKTGKMKQLSAYKQYKKEKRMERFLPPLMSVKMCEMNPDVIRRLLEDAVLAASGTFGRCNFNEELKDLRSIFSWYKDEVDFSFHYPVMKYHPSIGVIKAIPRKEKIMTIDQVLLFIDHLEEPFKTMAITQFCAALRIGEVAALNIKTVDFKTRKASIIETMVWLKDKPVLKDGTKAVDATIDINEVMFRGLKDLDTKRPSGCIYFFHYKGKPMRYQYILKAYNQALKDAGLIQFTGTHFLRHTAATLTRRKHGIDAAQAILRHTTSRMSEHYAKLDVNEKSSMVVIEAGEIFLRGRATNATSEKKSLMDSVV